MSIFFKCLLKLLRLVSCLNACGNAFHIFGARYRQDLKPCFVELTLGIVRISLPQRFYVEALRRINSFRVKGVPMFNTLKTQLAIFKILWSYNETVPSFLTLYNPKIKIWILICSPYSFPTEVVGRSW